MTGRISYRRDPAGRLVPSRVKATFIDKEDASIDKEDASADGDLKLGLGHTYEFETDEYDGAELPDADFTLAPYNLTIPEPDGRWAATKRAIYIACGIVTLSLYLVFNRLHRAHQSRHAVEGCEAV
jgi:hypothetical protein